MRPRHRWSLGMSWTTVQEAKVGSAGRADRTGWQGRGQGSSWLTLLGLLVCRGLCHCGHAVFEPCGQFGWSCLEAVMELRVRSSPRWRCGCQQMGGWAPGEWMGSPRGWTPGEWIISDSQESNLWAI